MSDDLYRRRPDRWAELRFSIVGPLLAAPPKPGELQFELKKLSAKSWRHPITGSPTQFGQSTIERWYYVARAEAGDRVGALRRKQRRDRGQARRLSKALRRALRAQYKAHPRWSYQLHWDNARVLVERNPELGPMPSYSTVRRFMKRTGLIKQRRRRGGRNVLESKVFEVREVRSFEVEYVHGLFHLDFHVGSLKVLMPDGEWVSAHLLAVLDDCSRLCCHAQWYLAETAENLVHGLCQAFQKRGLAAALMSDNGSAMVAEETTKGLERLGVVHHTTLPYSPYQNAKQENFWAQIEGRLLSMLENLTELTLDLLNEATQSWVELDYNRKIHSEIGQPPLTKYLDHKSVGRESPSSEALRFAFCVETSRRQRRSDGTLSLEGVRFEIPNRFRHFDRVYLRYPRWDLSYVHLVDERDGTALCRIYPLDKTKNASGERSILKTPIELESAEPQNEIAPLLQKLMQEYASTGLPPAYLPKPETPKEKS